MPQSTNRRATGDRHSGRDAIQLHYRLTHFRQCGVTYPLDGANRFAHTSRRSCVPPNVAQSTVQVLAIGLLLLLLFGSNYCAHLHGVAQRTRHTVRSTLWVISVPMRQRRHQWHLQMGSQVARAVVQAKSRASDGKHDAPVFLGLVRPFAERLLEKRVTLTRS